MTSHELRPLCEHGRKAYDLSLTVIKSLELDFGTETHIKKRYSSYSDICRSLNIKSVAMRHNAERLCHEAFFSNVDRSFLFSVFA
ncbi:hypothetical protein TNCV_4520781 [Trichonephila clavipes]|nr:hypothetical protein TNCV_4520781 [Trichonephila clavipes]